MQGDKDGKVVGYWRRWGPLTHTVIREAGHMVKISTFKFGFFLILVLNQTYIFQPQPG